MIDQWARKWGIPAEAIADFKQQIGTTGSLSSPDGLVSEAGVQSQLRVFLARTGELSWRNNVGAMQDDNGRVIRFGLCNDSKKVNEQFKSSDLIGIRPVTITPGHVGTVIGQFTSRECKHPGWSYTGKGREPAQLAWINLINAAGGYAKFTTGDA